MIANEVQKLENENMMLKKHKVQEMEEGKEQRGGQNDRIGKGD